MAPDRKSYFYCYSSNTYRVRENGRRHPDCRDLVWATLLMRGGRDSADKVPGGHQTEGPRWSHPAQTRQTALSRARAESTQGENEGRQASAERASLAVPFPGNERLKLEPEYDMQ